MSETPSIFSRIVTREIPAEILYENDDIIAIRDIKPQAEVHLLVIPKKEYPSVVELAEDDPQLLAQLVRVAKALAVEHSNGEFRLIFNTGESTGQTVFHVHGHVLSGNLTEGSLAL